MTLAAALFCALHGASPAAEQTGVRVYPALCGIDLEAAQQTLKDPAAAQAMFLQKKVVAITGKSDVAKSKGELKTYMLGREAGFTVQDEKPVAKPEPAYLVDPDWAATPARSVTEAAVSFLNASDRETTCKALVLSGCPTNPAHYQSIVVIGEAITEMRWIVKELPAAPVEGEAAQAADPQIAAMNEALVKAKADVAPIQPNKSRIALADERVQAFTKVAAQTAELEGFRPVLLIQTKDAPLLAFQNESGDVLKLAKLAAGKIEVVQTSF